jgi:hypothetical protein
MSWHRPRCPRCGSRNVREWGTLYIGYDVIAISDEGELRNDNGPGDLCCDSYQYEHLQCRECDYQNDDPMPWIPQPDVVHGQN